MASLFPKALFPKVIAAPRSALDLKRNQVRALLRIYRESHHGDRSAKVQEAFARMVRSARN